MWRDCAIYYFQFRLWTGFAALPVHTAAVMFCYDLMSNYYFRTATRSAAEMADFDAWRLQAAVPKFIDYSHTTWYIRTHRLYDNTSECRWWLIDKRRSMCRVNYCRLIDKIPYIYGVTHDILIWNVMWFHCEIFFLHVTWPRLYAFLP